MALPPSSPRLPSPPPPAEIQIGPKSPLMGPNAARQANQIEHTAIDTNAKRRIHPGTKAADMAVGPPLVPLHELDSAFQLQEHLAASHYYHTASRTIPISRETAKLLATPPPGIDKTLWLYELCRFLIAQCNGLIIGFLFDTPPCSAATCPEMRAGEWQFLCAVHDTPKSCCAIDYCCHTLDWAANVVTNPKIFPSRFIVDAHDRNTALKNLINVFRRLHRIFAHAWFQHRGVFWSTESQSGLYVFFKTVCDVYDLLPAENYKLPPEAEGLDSSSGTGDLGERGADRRQSQQPMGPISIAKPPSQREGENADYSAMSRTNTRRHIKSSPSVGSAVTTVHEADEDESADLSTRMGEMRISAPRAGVEEEGDSASIPVIVEHRAMATTEQPGRPSSVVPPPGTVLSESQPEPDQEPEAVKQEPEPAKPEHEFAAEPEAPAQTQPEAEPESKPEPQPEAGSKAEEPEIAAAAEDQQQHAEPPITATSEEPVPEIKESVTEIQEPVAAATADEASEKDSASAPLATVTDEAETKTDAEAPDAAEKTGEPDNQVTEEPSPEPQAVAKDQGQEDEQEDKAKEEKEDTKEEEKEEKAKEEEGKKEKEQEKKEEEEAEVDVEPEKKDSNAAPPVEEEIQEEAEEEQKKETTEEKKEGEAEKEEGMKAAE